MTAMVKLSLAFDFMVVTKETILPKYVKFSMGIDHKHTYTHHGHSQDCFGVGGGGQPENVFTNLYFSYLIPFLLITLEYSG
jgi:hypothetical protein